MSEVADHEEILKAFLKGRDGHFVCAGCGGDIVVAGEREERKDFACNGCGQKLRECTVCHFPRSTWGDDGSICAGCVLDSMEGKTKLTEEQWRGIAKWVVVIDKPQSPQGGKPEPEPANTVQGNDEGRSIMRREMVSLSDPVEGPIVLGMVAGMLRQDQ